MHATSGAPAFIPSETSKDVHQLGHSALQRYCQIDSALLRTGWLMLFSRPSINSNATGIILAVTVAISIKLGFFSRTRELSLTCAIPILLELALYQFLQDAPPPAQVNTLHFIVIELRPTRDTLRSMKLSSSSAVKALSRLNF